jgi:ABC-2 type transport system ATP-binding protein
MKPIIKVEGLRKVYGDMVAVDDVSFGVMPGEIFGMVGPNGAGKTTTVECIEGLRKPDGGRIRILDLDPQKDRKALRERTGIQLQQSVLPARMKVWEALDLYASFYRNGVDWKDLMDQLSLTAKKDAAFGKLSGGQKQRLFIALALLPDPEIVFLDELTTGLDPQARHATWDLIRDVRDRGKTVYLTTHFMEEAQNLCDRVAILDHGRIVALDTPENLIDRVGLGERVIFNLDITLPDTFKDRLPQGAQISREDDRVIITGEPAGAGELVGEVVQLLTELGLPFHDLRSEQANLEDVFLKMTGNEMRD